MGSQKVKELIKALVKNDNFDSYDDVTDYVEKLSKSNLDTLQSEITNLTEEKRIIKEQTQELAFSNYKTFVDTADTSKCIMNDFNKTIECVDKTLENLPKFVDECENFSSIVHGNMKRKMLMSKIRTHSDKLMELVNLPNLMKSALNIGDYESALDLFSFVGNLSARYMETPIIQQIASEVNKQWFETLFVLYNQLRYDLPLPQCLQILGYLRRANTVFTSGINDTPATFNILKMNKLMLGSNDTLHLHFLKARSAWLHQSLSDSINSDGEEIFLRRIVEIYRIHLFNVLTQHKAIFLSDSVQDQNNEETLSGNIALSSWLQQKIEDLREMLQSDLDKEEESSFESVYNQCMYLCLSFGRVGADMRYILTPVFRDTIKRNFWTNLENVNRQFDNEMRNFKIVTSPKSNITSDTNYNGPPEVLLDYYPLAEYCNNILTIFNSIRITAPLDLVKDVYNGINSSFYKATDVILSYYQREQQTFSQQERGIFVLFCRSFVEDLIPYISRCLIQVFPSQMIAEQLGISLSLLQESKLLNIDCYVFVEKLSHIITPKSIT